MPAMTSTTRRPRAASSAALSRIQKSAIVKAAPKPKESKKEKIEKEKEMCTICMDDLSETRQTKIACGHQFHRTCILNWLEKQLRSSDQACPNCRAPYEFIMNGRRKELVGAYGDHQQPSLWYIHGLAKERQKSAPRMYKTWMYKTCLELTLQRQLAKTMEMLKQLQAERAKFYAKGYVQARQFVYDIDDEMAKLSDRKKIYKEMEILAGAIGKGLLPERSPDVAWNLKAELSEALCLSKPVREPTPFDSSDSSEDEVVEEEEESESDSDSDIPIFNGGVMRIHAPRMHSRRRYIIINDSDDEDDQADTRVAMTTGGRVPRHLLETREATSSQ